MFSASKTAGPSGYNINNSLRFRASATAYLTRTFGTPTNNKIWTWSSWVKRGLLGSTRMFFGYGISGTLDYFGFNSSDQLYYFSVDNGGSTQRANYNTVALFRDPSAWYHIVFAVDTTQATAANRFKLYVNGVQQTLTTTTSLALNWNTYINSALAQGIGYVFDGTSPYFDGYMAEINFIDGQQLAASSFGSTNSTTGVWQPARYTGTYGNNGFYLKFNNIALTSGSNTGLGQDSSGNGNFWNTNNISVTAGVTYDAMTDSPTLTSTTVANYGVLNPLDRNSSVTVSQANLTGNTASINVGIRGTFGVSSGKWYYEGVVTARGGAQVDQIFGVALSTWDLGYVGSAAGVGYGGSGSIYSPLVAPPGVASFGINDIIGVAFDVDALTISFYKNNSLQGTYSLPGAGFYFVATSFQNSTQSINCGQRPFAYTPPTGYKALNTYNLPDSTIVKGNTVMDASLWTGDSTSPRAVVSTLNFKPDFVWTKVRSNTYSNTLYDSVRGGGQALFSDTTGAEQANYVNGYIQSFNSNGWTMQNGSSGGIVLNNSGQTYVAWQWQAGQGTTSSNTTGSITSTVSVNATAGFSIVTYTGTGANATVGHGLGVAPKFYIVKRRNASGDYWCCYHVSIGATNGIYLNTTDAAGASTLWQNTSPTSSVFSVSTTTGVNASGGTYVAYCWAEIAGFSKFGSYTGNGSTDGTFVYTGFRPKFVLVKRTNTAGDSWFLQDSSRSTYNVVSEYLLPNTSDAAASYNSMDFLSNGFKLRATGSGYNASGSTYIYMAFAENPFKNALAR